MANISTPGIVPFLWFSNYAGEAVKYDISVSKDSRIINHNPIVSTFEPEERPWKKQSMIF